MEMSLITSVVLPFIAAWIISMIIGKIAIPVLRRLKFGQEIREEGPKSHQKKAGTPTMGGVIFMIPIILLAIIFAFKYPLIIPVLIATVGMSLVGFCDDYIKVVKKRNLGLTEKQKLLGQLIVAVVFLAYMFIFTDVGTTIYIPFTNIAWKMPVVLYVIFAVIALLATVNGTNFTDGLDGLLSSITIVVAFFFAAAGMILGIGVAPIAAMVAGALVGFMFYNVHPAKVFMGDTGSLAMGGFVAGIAFVMNRPFLIVIAGLIYVIELLSSVIQVSYFKITHGKRVFKMAPIHHHFELCGWPETKVVTIFTMVAIIACVVALAAL